MLLGLAAGTFVIPANPDDGIPLRSISGIIEQMEEEKNREDEANIRESSKTESDQEDEVAKR